MGLSTVAAHLLPIPILLLGAGCSSKTPTAAWIADFCVATGQVESSLRSTSYENIAQQLFSRDGLEDYKRYDRDIKLAVLIADFSESADMLDGVQDPGGDFSSACIKLLSQDKREKWK